MLCRVEHELLNRLIEQSTKTTVLVIGIDCNAVEIDNEHGEVCAFCITFAPDAPHAGVNHQWFADRFESFVYLDRIAIDSNHQNRGLGALLYQSVEQLMLDSAEHSLLCCEVNLEPPNPGSLRFHKRIGFTEIGQYSPQESYLVSMLSKNLNA